MVLGKLRAAWKVSFPARGEIFFGQRHMKIFNHKLDFLSKWERTYSWVKEDLRSHHKESAFTLRLVEHC